MKSLLVCWFAGPELSCAGDGQVAVLQRSRCPVQRREGWEFHRLERHSDRRSRDATAPKTWLNPYLQLLVHFNIVSNNITRLVRPIIMETFTCKWHQNDLEPCDDDSKGYPGFEGVPVSLSTPSLRRCDLTSASVVRSVMSHKALSQYCTFWRQSVLISSWGAP